MCPCNNATLDALRQTAEFVGKCSGPGGTVVASEEGVHCFLFSFTVENVVGVELKKSKLLDVLQGFTVELVGSGESRLQETGGAILLQMLVFPTWLLTSGFAGR